VDHLAVIGLHFNGHAETGMSFLRKGAGLLIEDCLVEGYGINVALLGVEGRISDVILRRCVIVDATSPIVGGRSQGIYAYGVDDLLVEQCVLDNNGDANIYSHDVYFDNGNTGCVLRGNIISRPGSHGAQMRSGGVAYNNLFVRCPIGLQLGGGNTPEPGGVKFKAIGNVVVEGADINDADPRGWGDLLRNIKSGQMIRNLIAHSAKGTQLVALNINGDHKGDDGVLDHGVHAVYSEGNVIFDWPGVEVFGNTSDLVQQFDNYDLEDADYVSTKKYPMPRRSVGGFDEFMLEARQQSRARWRPEFTAQAVNRYLRDGFQMTGPKEGNT